MFFNIDKGINNKDNYNEEYYSYNEMTNLLQNVKEIKLKLKNHLKKNKYVKYAYNGEDYIYLFPNSKFFKKYKNESTQQEFIKEVLKVFLVEELNFNKNTDAVEYVDVEIEENVTSKSIIKITFM